MSMIEHKAYLALHTSCLSWMCQPGLHCCPGVVQARGLCPPEAHNLRNVAVRLHEHRAKSSAHELPAVEMLTCVALVPQMLVKKAGKGCKMCAEATDWTWAQRGSVQVAATVQRLCPPRGGIRLLAAEVTHSKGRELDYLIAQQLILDTVHYFDGDRLACARRLAHGEAPACLHLFADSHLQAVHTIRKARGHEWTI